MPNDNKNNITLTPWDYPALKRYESSDILAYQTPLQVDEIEETRSELGKQDDKELELEAKNQYLKQQSDLFCALNDKLGSAIEQINEALFLQLIDVVKNLTQKLISQSLQTDNSGFKEKIEQTLTAISEEKCELQLSSKDYGLIKNEIVTSKHIEIKANPQIQPGEFTINTPYEKIVSSIEDLLNQVLGAQHD